jgi:hypothetical protein
MEMRHRCRITDGKRMFERRPADVGKGCGNA